MPDDPVAKLTAMHPVRAYDRAALDAHLASGERLLRRLEMRLTDARLRRSRAQSAAGEQEVSAEIGARILQAQAEMDDQRRANDRVIASIISAGDAEEAQVLGDARRQVAELRVALTDLLDADRGPQVDGPVLAAPAHPEGARGVRVAADQTPGAPRAISR